jgi:hypothetical protein
MIWFDFAIADSMFPSSCAIQKLALNTEEAKAYIASAKPCLNPSHQATINALTSRFGLDVEIPSVPPKVTLETGDAIVVMGVRGLPRLTDRHEYTAEEIAGASFEFALYEVVAPYLV